ncbi:purine binding chemotaxis protein CheW [Oceanococcus atlanticus]|uniref:Chemotaxis protein CheW n=1 Tax=Oceanococcus atlanticus TaxID=1317117 RepID=A0A1Y1SGU3_9GAMM|nr:chemotaxis protein CheW [Oceanococcus atlanticus]ORE88886.1 purine binding chemotaxis protein CheW [Oceanococcus atlanticus]
MNENQDQALSSADDKAGQLEGERREFLSFRLGAEEYGVDILKVQEIRSYDSVTRLPEAPAYIKGVINLRGTIVPVVDLRLKLKLEQAEYDQQTVMIILNMADKVIGMIVDGVSDVLTLAESQIRPPPEFNGVLDTRYITGLGAIDDRMLILVDIECLMSASDMTVLENAA